jgi:hypothetical protein
MVCFLAEDKRFVLLQNTQTGSGGHPACCSVNSRSLFTRLKQLEREADCSPLFGAEVKNE